jgi:hypothetical protein
VQPRTDAGARTLTEFAAQAIVGVQSASGYEEGARCTPAGEPGARTTLW